MFPELWGGFECTVHRIGNHYFDQIERTGHHHRLADLDAIAALGIQKVRYPVLWERTECNGTLEWRWPDERLNHLRALKMQAIVGLLHHGSGPAHTDLMDSEFPQKFSAYARAVAERYPWVEHYTPINEPLTTARFSGLYGHWYPHQKSDRSFARALIHQCRGIVLAMQAIRAVNSSAALIQTEDLGKTFSTSRMGYQARFENHRRWLTFDLLSSRVDPRHPMWRYLVESGVSEAELRWFLENPCGPDILGINHYLTSDRYLDERLNLYPPSTHGGNGRDRYADVEVIRVAATADTGPAARLSEIWSRYTRPVAITEAHLGCCSDEQLRWFFQAWSAARTLQARGCDVRAVTAWALLGSFDWNSLLTRNDNVYEPGVFDLRSGSPIGTPLAELVRELANGRNPTSPCLRRLAWWQKPERVLYRQEYLPEGFLEQSVDASLLVSP